jgi:hypothetical protein
LSGDISAPAGARLRELRNDPQIIYNRVERQRIGGEEHLVADAAVHGVYRLPMQYLVDAIADIDDHDDYIPGVVESREVCSRQGVQNLKRQRITTSFGFLFFRQSYENTVDIYSTHEPQATSWLSWVTLHRSHDGKLADVSGVWYLEQVRLGAERATYIQRRSRTVFEDEPLGLEAALSAFSGNQLRHWLTALHEEAERRAKR